jgi:hypothetical protein
MLRKVLLLVCIFVTIVTVSIVVNIAHATPLARGNTSYEYQYIATSNFRHFVNPKSMSTTIGRQTPDVIVADQIGQQTQITRLDNADEIGQVDSVVNIIATLDYFVDEIAVVQNTSSEYLISLSDNTLRVSTLANGKLGTPRKYDNVLAFDAYQDRIYMLQLNSSGVYFVVKVELSTYGTSQIRVPTQAGQLSQLVISSNPIPEALEELEYYTVQSNHSNYFEVKKVSQQQFLPQVFAIDTFDITHLRLNSSSDKLFYAVAHRLNVVDITTEQVQHKSLERILSAQLIQDTAYFIQQDIGSGNGGSRSLQSITTKDLESAQPITLLKSQSNQLHFYDSPNAVTSRRGKVFVADTFNKRVAVLSDGTTSYQQISTNVTSVAISRLDIMYSLRQTNTGSAIDTYTLHNNSLIGSIATTIRLSGIVIDALDHVYVYSDNVMYTLQDNEIKLLHNFNNNIIYDINVVPDQVGVYVLNGSNNTYFVSLILPNQKELGDNIPFGSRRPTSITIDFNRNIFALYDGGDLVKHNQNGDELSRVAVPTVYSGSNTDMAISMANFVTATGQTINVGDLLISHTNSNALISVNKTWADVEIPDWDNYIHPDYTSNGPGLYAPEPITRTTLANATLFSYPTEMLASGITLDAGSRVILVDPQPNSIYSFVMLDQVQAGTFDTPTVGYILSSLLTTLQEDRYTPPITNSAIIAGTTKLYRYPSSLSVPLVNDDFVLQDGTSVTVMSFGSYHNNSATWSRIQYQPSSSQDIYIGFVPNHFLNMSDYFVPGSQRIPRANATINGEDVTTAVPFISGSQIVNYTVEIPAGTRVHVVGTFNPNARMTTISFYDSKLNGVFTAEVPTVVLTYDNITITQIIAFGMGIFVTILLVLAFVFYKSIKHKTMINQLEDNIELPATL